MRTMLLAGKRASVAAAFVGVAAMPSSTTGTPPSVPDGCARQGGGTASATPAPDCRWSRAGRRRDRCRRDDVGGMGGGPFDVPEGRLGRPVRDDNAAFRVEEGSPLDSVDERDLPWVGGRSVREAGRCVIGVDDNAVTRLLMAHDLLLRGAVPVEAAVELQVIGPEGDHRREVGLERMKAR